MRGDYFVVRTKGPVAWLIRRVTRSPYNHAGVCIGNDLTVESKMSGARTGHLSDYDVIAFSTFPLTDSERVRVVDEAERLLGIPYGFADLMWLALLQWGVRFSFVKRWVDKTDDLVCSQLVALCYLKAGIYLSEDDECPLDCTPGDLAQIINEAA